jgi:hypothetical protein
MAHNGLCINIIHYAQFIILEKFLDYVHYGQIVSIMKYTNH